MFLFIILMVLQPFVYGHFNVSDSIIYNMDWPGHLQEEEISDGHLVTIKSSDKEEFYCHIPSNSDEKSPVSPDGPNEYLSATAIMIQKVLISKPCIFRVDEYWIFELCHGASLVQYHDERESNNRIQFVLGFYNPEASQNTDLPDTVPPTINVNGEELPYYGVNMTDGSVCDLSQRPRHTILAYVCNKDGHGEMLSISELETCVYRAIILTAHLCAHPKYRPRQKKSKQISCVPVNKKMPAEPAALVQMKYENNAILSDISNRLDSTIRFSMQSSIDSGERSVFIVRGNSKQAQTIKTGTLNLDKPSNGYNVKLSAPALDPSNSQSKPKPSGASSIVNSFLSGERCATTTRKMDDFWLYQLCFRKQVLQIHQEEKGSVMTVNLGKWNPKRHLKWLRANPGYVRSSMVKNKKMVHFYGDGDMCELSRKPRETIVEIICDQEGNDVTSMAFNEYKICHYVLVLSGKMFCPVIKASDKYGLMPNGFKLD